MSTTIPDSNSTTLAALVARIELLEQGQDALDAAVVDNGVQVDRLRTGLSNAIAAAGQASYADPVVARIKARRDRQRRIQAMGLRVLPGGGS